jgi:hypothetical protein
MGSEPATLLGWLWEKRILLVHARLLAILAKVISTGPSFHFGLHKFFFVVVVGVAQDIMILFVWIFFSSWLPKVDADCQMSRL